MIEITRIHIAKVAYDIELDAKKDIESYIGALERYANDQEILTDIEIRITELLAERGVLAGGVIAKDDVAAVRSQLGEPSDFASEGMDGAAAEGTDDASGTEDNSRRVYRDESDAMVGGVLAGLSRFLGIDPLWVRLLFIVLLFASFGTALIMYLVLWLVIPPAQTTADKLRMSGRPVTLASIKELAGSEERRSERAAVIRRALSVVAGSVLVLMAISGILATAAVISGFGWGRFSPATEGWMFESWWFMAMAGLFILSGLLFSALCFVLASAAFRRQWSKRVGVSVIAIVVAGLVVFTSGIGVGMYGYTREQARISELRETTAIDLPASFMNVKSITFNSGSNIHGDIRYVVADKPSYTLDSLPGVKADLKLSNDGSSMTVGLREDSPRTGLWLEAPMLTIYGPTLDTINVGDDKTVAFYRNEAEQGSLSITTQSGSQLNVEGTYTSVKVAGDAYSRVNLEDAAITELSVDGGGVRAGVVRLLSVTQPDVCPAHDWYEGGYSMTVREVSGGKLIYNGKEEPAKTISNSCGKVVIGNEDGRNEEL